MTIGELYRFHQVEVDHQHTRIHSIVERMAASSDVMAFRETVGQLLDSLIEWVKQHFAFEEEFMRRCRYPEHLDHESEHEGLIQRLHAIERHTRLFGVHGLKTLSIHFEMFWTATALS